MIRKLLSLSVLCFTFTGFAQLPSLEWARKGGASNYDMGNVIQTDQSGNVYTAGIYSLSTATFSGLTLANSGSSDVFISKYNSSGQIVWVRSIVGPSAEYFNDMVIDQQGNLFITGIMSSDSITAGALKVYKNGVNDIFLAKLSSSGNFQWLKAYGSTGSETINGLDIDQNGGLLATGEFTASSILFDSYTLTNSSTSSDIFLLKFDINGTVQLATSIQGNSTDMSKKITHDAIGNIYISGFFTSNSLVSGAVTVNKPSGTGTSNDLFLMKFDAFGSIIWGKTYGGSGNDRLYNLDVDPTGNVFIAGDFSSSSLTFDAFQLLNLGSNTLDIYLAKIDPNGSTLWAKSAGNTTSSDSEIHGLEVDLAGNSYISGFFQGTTMSFGSSTINNNGLMNAFLAKYDANGNLFWVYSFGGNGNDNGTGLKVDQHNTIYLTGGFQSTCDFDPGSAQVNLGTSGNTDVFSVKLKQTGVFGFIFSDLNQNCVKDNSESAFPSMSATIQPGNIQVQSDAMGQWYLSSLPVGNYTLALSNYTCVGVPSCSNSQTFSITQQDTLIITSQMGILPYYLDTTVAVDVCQPYTAPDGQIHTTSGVYTASIPSLIHACDSTITINLTVNQVSAAADVFNNSLTATTSGAVYQWLDCSASLAAISGETGRGFAAMSNGQYAVSITKNGCSDTSICYTISSVDPEQHDTPTTPNTIRYVKYNATGSNNGTSWANAYTSLQAALSASVSGNQIWVAAGTYKPTTGTNRTLSFSLKNGVSIYGGFNGTETQLSQRNWEQNPCTLSGDIGAQGVATDNSFHVVFSVNTTSGTLDGFYITNGRADSTSNYAFGGGMFTQASTITFDRLEISGNYATKGGGIYFNNSSPKIMNSRFKSNTASIGGGGMYCNYNASPRLINCLIKSNTSPEGAGMYNYNQANPVLTNCEVSDNIGEGMRNFVSSSPILESCVFKSNTVNGIYSNASTVTINNSSFILNPVSFDFNNDATIYIDSSQISFNGYGLKGFDQCHFYITACEFTYNTNKSINMQQGTYAELADCFVSYNSAGGIYMNNNCYVKLDDCQFIGNYNGSGGAISYYYASIVARNVLFARNGALSGGGAIYTSGQANANSRLYNCTFEGNYTYSTNPHLAGGAISIATGGIPMYNCIFQNNWFSNHIIDQPGSDFNTFAGPTPAFNCQFQTSAIPCTNCPAYGLDSKFVDVNDLDGPDDIWATADDGLRLTCNSPNVNIGNNAYVSITSLDISGMNRVMNGTVDLGAYETDMGTGPSSSTINEATCSPYTAPDGQVFLTSGIYVVTIPNASGCDSVITINLSHVNCIQLKSYYCNRTLTNLNDYMACDPVSGATAYRFEVTDGTNTYTYDSPSVGFRLTLIPAIKYGTSYGIRVAAKVGGDWTEYGPSCDVTTPLTRMQTWYCGITVSPMSQYLACYAVQDAIQYKFKLFDGTNTLYYISNSVGFRMSLVPGIQTNTTYAVSISVNVGGLWSNYGPACNITSAAVPSAQSDNETIEQAFGTEQTSPFEELQVEIFPNPTTGQFVIQLDQVYGKIEAVVRDLNGRLIQSTQAIDSRELKLELNEADGVYLVYIQVDELELKVERLIKHL